MPRAGVDPQRWMQTAAAGSPRARASLRAELGALVDRTAAWDEVARDLVRLGVPPRDVHLLIARAFHPELIDGRLHRTSEPWSFTGEEVTPYYLTHVGRLVVFGPLDLYPELAQLRLLRELIVPRGVVTRFPEQLGLLPGLKRLCLRSNSIDALPPNLTGFAALEDLDLGGNRLVEVPATLGRLLRLRRLRLHHNQLTSLPEGFAALGHLEHLNLYGNGFTSFPRTLFALRRLRSLNLRGNPIPPDELATALRRFPDLEERGRPRYGGRRSYPLGRAYIRVTAPSAAFRGGTEASGR